MTSSINLGQGRAGSLVLVAAPCRGTYRADRLYHLPGVPSPGSLSGRQAQRRIPGESGETVQPARCRWGVWVAVSRGTTYVGAIWQSRAGGPR